MTSIHALLHPPDRPSSVACAGLFTQCVSAMNIPGAGVTEVDDRQVTTVFTVQPSFHHRHSTNRVSWSVIIVSERRCDCTFAEDGNASCYSVC